MYSPKNTKASNSSSKPGFARSTFGTNTYCKIGKSISHYTNVFTQKHQGLQQLLETRFRSFNIRHEHILQNWQVDKSLHKCIHPKTPRPPTAPRNQVSLVQHSARTHTAKLASR